MLLIDCQAQTQIPGRINPTDWLRSEGETVELPGGIRVILADPGESGVHALVNDRLVVRFRAVIIGESPVVRWIPSKHQTEAEYLVMARECLPLPGGDKAARIRERMLGEIAVRTAMLALAF